MDAKALAAKLPVALDWLEELDRPEYLGALPDAAGDSYLCRFNPVFAAVRDSALRCGFRFSSADTPLWRDYNFFPLITIDAILASRIIPYADNWGTLRRFRLSNPGAPTVPAALLLRQLRRNHTLHEAAHGLAHHALEALRPRLAALSKSAKHLQVTEALLGEAFANAVETIATGFRHMPLPDEIFYALNSYSAPTEKNAGIVRQAAAEKGAAGLFLHLTAAFVEAQWPPDATRDAEERVLERILQSTGPSADAELARRIMPLAFRLNPSFRENTTPFYFERHGCGEEFRQYAASGWLSQPEHAAFFRDFVRHAAPLVLSGRSTAEPPATRTETTR